MKNKFNIKKFTLIELIIVIVVIGLLAGMALPKFIGVQRDSKVAAMQQDLDVLEKAVQLYESNNDGAEPFIADGSGNYTKVSITRQTLKDSLDSIGDDESSVYTLDMEELKPYLERLKYIDPTMDLYLYSTKTGVAINEQGKTDSNGIIHHILNGIKNSKTKTLSIMINSSFSNSSFIISKSGTLYSFGRNSRGQLGDGTTTDKTTPTKIILENGINFTQISSGAKHSMAIGSDGELYTWGDNEYGQLGDGNSGYGVVSTTPKKVTLASGVKPTQIACGFTYSMAIGDDGNLYTWGWNNYGQLGDGTTTQRNKPMKITLESGVKSTQIACDSEHSMAIGSDGELYAWGANYYGQLGDGTYKNKSTPTKITLASGVKSTQIACGNCHSMAIGSDGELYTWGGNSGGQLGDGTTIDKATPTKITLASGVKPTQISAGSHHIMAIGDDGNIYIWGYNGHGQLGDGTTINKATPTKITLASGIKPTQIVCGILHSMAIGSDGELYTWGDNIGGQLGDGTTTNKLIPTKINFNFE